MDMKMRGFSLLGIALLGAVVLAQDSIQLRRQFVVDQEDVYKVTVNGKNTFESPMGTQEMEMKGSMKYLFKVTKLEEEKADVEVSVKDLQMKVISAAGEQDAPGGTGEGKLTGKLDGRNRATGFEASASAMSMMSGSASVPFIEFPENAVKVGDTWKVAPPSIPALKAKEGTELEAKLVGERDGFWVVTLVGTVPFTMDSSQMAEAAQLDITGSGTYDLNYENLVDKKTGKVVQAVNKMNTKLTMEVMGQQIPGSGTVETKYVLER